MGYRMHPHFQCPLIFIAVRGRTALLVVTFAIPLQVGTIIFLPLLFKLTRLPSLGQNSSPSNIMHRRERTHSIVSEGIQFSLFVLYV